MNVNDLKGLIPKHKSDFESVDKIIKLGYPKIKPILPELLNWMQDGNWPIYRTLAPFLSSIGIEIIPEIKNILQSEDYIWQYWCLVGIVEVIGKKAIYLLKNQLERLRDNPTEEEKAEYLQEVASDLLNLI
ncbi:MAG: DUF5071 domain-containing protein [Candidatus Lokiarchaeota archaeon]|nr:DUF5071 domain-containing protein [Candidatus Lokiarchaeota archaeon]